MSPTKANGTGHCDTLVVDDEPTEGVSGSTTEALCALAPVGLLAELTHRCPLQCSYCSNPLELERVNKELSTAEWVSVMEQAGAMGILHVHLSGGEPTAQLRRHSGSGTARPGAGRSTSLSMVRADSSEPATSKPAQTIMAVLNPC